MKSTDFKEEIKGGNSITELLEITFSYKLINKILI